MPGAFSDETRRLAESLRQRIQSGEAVPREELISFLKAGEKEMQNFIRLDAAPPAKPVKPPPPKDVDFF